MKGTYVNPKDVLVDSDPRIVEARRNWSKCMRSLGYEYKADQDEIIDEYSERLDELLEGDDPTSLTGQRAAELHKLQQEEIAVSLADLDCQIKYTDEVYRKVEIEVYGQPVSG
jgi:superfamily I DNA and RNA helicase